MEYSIFRVKFIEYSVFRGNVGWGGHYNVFANKSIGSDLKSY